PRRPADRIAGTRKRPATAAADLVAKQPQPADEAAADGACGGHASTRLVGVRRRRELDRVAIVVQLDHQRGVIEVASCPTLRGGFDGLEDTPVEADAVATRAERNPVQI